MIQEMTGYGWLERAVAVLSLRHVDRVSARGLVSDCGPGIGSRAAKRYDGPRLRETGRMAKLADARDLKSRGEKSPCGFDPRSGH